jgi:hypothetical protein
MPQKAKAAAQQQLVTPLTISEAELEAELRQLAAASSPDNANGGKADPSGTPRVGIGSGEQQASSEIKVPVP